MDFTCYAEDHARRLTALLQTEEWERAVQSGAVQAAESQLLTPPKMANVFALPVEQLKALNEGAVRQRIAAGERHEERLLQALGAWPAEWPKGFPVRLSFVGLCLTLRCDMTPRCLYCNQRPVAEEMPLSDWCGLIRTLAPAEGDGPYLYLTGGEPLLLGEGLWGEEGLLRTAHAAGAACNLNTNALTLTARAALGLVSAGLGRVHVSLDTQVPEVQDRICARRGRWEQIMRGIYNLQIAKALLGAAHPVIHINCVLTRLNAETFPEFLHFLLSLKPRIPEGLSSDFDLHLIPVGGEQNADLRLTAEGYVRFFTETWARADAVWQEYLVERGVPEDQRKPLHEKIPFLSPFHRVEQRGDLREWSEAAAHGRPAALAMTQRCYVAPTQGFVLPDGSQYWCGGHATSRPTPVGNVREAEFRDNLQRAIGQTACLPGPYCHTCPGATQAINRSVENALRQTLREWLTPPAPGEERVETGGTCAEPESGGFE